ncbi:MAG: hypothetical protein LBR23_03470 [Spirochaetaceae bacterium]|jgi:hypothetical protein|nr:hypothetical protein [Spirochaetaceae bacterium]
MNGTAALRKELHTFIDTLPDRRLTVLRPLLAGLAEDADWTPIIEPANAEETAMIEETKAEYRIAPESFIPLEAISTR